ncbi:MAG: polyprenol-phosphate-mannose-dependent alpha-(1-2)-phosphatidylinositol mannoside mannosyltransferase [Pirellulaceae bacterium]|nr:MAG: polyprenol-phosphate-mannose-dependent alpha-(1-2)-phosphatidylinositol mannoside mannosyltransferase [Pirellulaceae bacterium]
MDRHTSRTIPNNTERSRVPGFLVWVLVAFFCLLAGWTFATVRSRPGDTRVYRLAAERYWKGETIYRRDDAAAFTYPPFFVLAYLPFAFMHPPWDRALWTAANLLLAIWVARTILVIALRSVSREKLSRKQKAAIIGMSILLQIRFLLSPITYQSHEYIVLALVVAGMVCWSWRGWLSGFFWGLAAACKATPLLFLAVLLWRRQLWEALVFVVVAAAATFLPDWLVGDRQPGPMVLDWYETFVARVGVAAAPDVAGAWRKWNHLNQSLSGTLYRLMTPVPNEWPLRWNVALVEVAEPLQHRIAMILKLMVLAVTLWATWRSSRTAARPTTWTALCMAATVLCGMLLLSPMSSRQHFAALAPAIAVCAVQWTTGRDQTLSSLALACVLVFGLCGAKDIIGAALQRQLSAYGAYTWCAVSGLAATALAAVQSRQSSDLGLPNA